MKAQYSITAEDVNILKRRVPHPCAAERCSYGQTPGDYAYCGCGREIHCDRKHTYEIWCGDAKAAGVWELAQTLLAIDEYRAEQKALQKKILGEVAKIAGNFGPGVLDRINHDLYDGKL